MNFFEAQDSARRKTWHLAALFIAAVAALIVMTNLLIAGVYVWTGNHALPQASNPLELLAGLPAEHWLLISAGVVGLVSVASLAKYLTLRSGGRSIAESMGGQMISYNDPDTGKRRVLNIVEEMAIASGIPVPPVYLIPEPSINAFAAGFSPDDAVIGINQGTVDHLNRDELQGVIGHEFSHILNGDTRINLRLIAILHGILFIGIIGYGILHGVGRGRGRRSSDGGLPILALALGLLAIGYAGTFFGNLIKAAVSRQREYLADAAAVQFTRNPSGIANALKKIGGLSYGSSIPSAAATEASHMFFGQSQTSSLNRMLSTHPPLSRRILAIEPSWSGRFTDTQILAPSTAMASENAASQGFANANGSAQLEISTSHNHTAKQVAVAVGQLNQHGLDAAVAIINSTDDSLREAAHDPWACRGLIHAMLLAADTQIYNEQLELLGTNTEPAVYKKILRLAPLCVDLDEAHKLTLVEMSITTLKELSSNQYKRFMANTLAMIKADSHIDLFEWVLHRLLVKELKPYFEGPKQVRARYHSLDQIADAAPTLLSALAREQRNADTRLSAFNSGLQVLGLAGEFASEDDPNFGQLNTALRTLRQLKALAKPKLIEACAEVVLADGHATARQGALLQGIAAALDCPLPPSIYSAQATGND